MVRGLSSPGVRLIVVGGSASSMLSTSLARLDGFELADTEIKRFPDGEGYVHIRQELDGMDVVIVQTTYPDENIIEMMILQDAVRRAGARSITAVVPYFGYGRQDKLFKAGEAVSADVMARALELGVDKVITIDIHNQGTLNAFSKPVTDISGMPQIAEYLRQDSPDVIISPDKGAVGRAKAVADILGCQWDHIEKTRINGETVEMKLKNMDVSNKTVAITDDIIATGGTIIKATEQLKAQGAKRVVAACTHGLFAGNAIERLSVACDAVISTDTLENEKSVVTVAPEIAKALGMALRPV